MDAEKLIPYVRWEEVNMSTDKGRREVHYYLKRKDGVLDLVVVGKERSLRHMSYRFVNNFNSALRPFSNLRLKSRREVVDWLNSIVSDTEALEITRQSSYTDDSDASELDIDNFKGTQLQKLGQHTKEFLWLGSPWTCRKRRKHYQAFRRNGVRISVFDFVYVLAEEDKRLVAYLEDMYEDSKGNKMVVVRWYHKVDEVGIALHHKFNDREIFSSLCLQDISVECIDGMAAVLSPQHFEKFLKEAQHPMLDLFVCDKLFENDDIKLFDITQVKGYWKQEILRNTDTVSFVMDQATLQCLDDASKLETDVSDDSDIIPRKMRQRLKHDRFSGEKHLMDTMTAQMHDLNSYRVDIRSPIETSLTGGECAPPATTSELKPATTSEIKQNPLQYLKVGSEVEVLSQDSGIRGCWFRALIIKKSKNKVKLRYQDVKDADNEENNLEEWIVATKIAVSDNLGFRICGRPIIRPPPKCNKGRVSWDFDVGTAVDAWWHDVWQEGIVFHKESQDRFRVYFPGVKKDSVFSRSDLRFSQEWLGNGWMHIKDRADIVTFLSFFSENQGVKSTDRTLGQIAISDMESEKSEIGNVDDMSNPGYDQGGKVKVVRDISKDGCLTQLSWNPLKKRKRSTGFSSQRMHRKNSGSKHSSGISSSRGCEKIVLPLSLKVDHENCKYMGDPLFSAAVAQPLTSLVMSR